MLIEHEIEMIVFLRVRVGGQNAQMPRHAKMYDQRAMIEAEQQVFAASASAAYRATNQKLVQSFRKWPAQPAVAQHHLAHSASFELRRNAAPCLFVFWLFWFVVFSFF